VPLLATESSNNWNAILIIPIYTSVDHRCYTYGWEKIVC